MQYALFGIVVLVLMNRSSSPAPQQQLPQQQPAVTPGQAPRDAGAQVADAAGAILGGIAGLVKAYQTETGR